MDETAQLNLPLLQPAQAQKHVTVNEAMMRLDALVQLVLVSRVLATPPAVISDGVAYGVPNGAVNDWAGHDGEVAIGSNGGWAFVTPKAGWSAWITDEGQRALHDGGNWRSGMVTLSPFGAGARLGVAEIEHTIAVGAVSTTSTVIPSHAVVLGVTARVVNAITGSLSTWQLGTPGAPDRFGSGLGVGEGSWANGVLSSPLTYYAPTALELTATGGDFTGGQVRLSVHFLELTLPSI
ncbi:DUF2793 domain-containing protein [Ostreiculturibacter nitratireducens]|uniref:DUF2793 domain-containing protein n=1 Tax=Ostreiculturibacter nitratireducens TaxID=3075226 RepID=UPI0031B6006D